MALLPLKLRTGALVGKVGVSIVCLLVPLVIAIVWAGVMGGLIVVLAIPLHLWLVKLFRGFVMEPVSFSTDDEVLGGDATPRGALRAE